MGIVVTDSRQLWRTAKGTLCEGKKHANLHERQIIHVAEDDGHWLWVEGLQGACHPA